MKFKKYRNGKEPSIRCFLIVMLICILQGQIQNYFLQNYLPYIAGRYVEFQISTLSFEEYLLFKETRTKSKIDNIYNEFELYLRLGGFPSIHFSEYDTDTIYKIVYDIYSSVILRDTIQRFNIRNIELLDRVVKFVFENMGNRFSTKNIADYFKSQQRKIDLNTIYNYLNALEGAFIIQRVPRYDMI